MTSIPYDISLMRGDAKTKRKKPPSLKDIRSYWASRIWKVKGFDSEEEFLETFYCFGCSMSYQNTENDSSRVQKAHIIPLCRGGTDHIENIHILCEECHFASEDMAFSSGVDVYMEWLAKRSFFDVAAGVYTRRNPGGFMKLLQEFQADSIKEAMEAML